MTIPAIGATDAQIEYNDLVECGEWLEDDGNCARYATGWETSEWVCHACECVIDDPSEHECDQDAE